jgi:CDP-diacylglycerol--glycerol-3-phosphate 3-phosphatidyltransferase
MAPQRADDDGSRDFAALRASGERPGFGRNVGGAIGRARDRVARVLILVGATPDRITLAGLAFTILGGYCLARGASQQVPYYTFTDGPVGWWPLLAAAALILASACDMLDGAVARLTGRGSRAGALLDSTVDRFSDIAIFLGCWLHFATRDTPSITYQCLALAALCNALLISYVKARAENMIDDCSVGFWLRGERLVAVMVGCLTGHVPAVLWQLTLSGAFTVARRVRHALGTLRAVDAQCTPPGTGPSRGWWGRLQIWCHPRGSIPYDFAVAAQLAYIIFAPLALPALCAASPHADPLRAWFSA